MTAYSLHPEVYNDLFEILAFIADSNPTAAETVRNKIREEFEAITMLPFAGHLRKDLTSRPLRFHSVYKYLIAYAPDIKPLPIIAVVHGSRNPAVLRAILSARKEDWAN